MDILSKFHKKVGPNKQVGWKMKKVGPNKQVGWKSSRMENEKEQGGILGKKLPNKRVGLKIS